MAAGESDPEVRGVFLRGGAGPSVAVKVAFVDSQRDEHGVQPVLQAFEDTPAQIAPSTYYAAKPARLRPGRSATFS